MLVFCKPRTVVLAVPKTGTTALETAFACHADFAARTRSQKKHMPAAQYRRTIDPWVQIACGGPAEVIAVFREPLDQLHSWYRYRQRLARTHPRSTRGMTFEQFMVQHLAPAPPPPARIPQQSGLVIYRSGGLAVDTLYRYDDFDALADELARRLGVEARVPRLNVSRRREQSDLSPATRRRFEAAYEPDYEIYESLPQRAPTI